MGKYNGHQKGPQPRAEGQHGRRTHGDSVDGPILQGHTHS